MRHVSVTIIIVHVLCGYQLDKRWPRFSFEFVFLFSIVYCGVVLA